MTKCIMHDRMEVPCHVCLNDFLKRFEGKYVHKCEELTESEGAVGAERVLLAYLSDSPDTPIKEQSASYIMFPGERVGERLRLMAKEYKRFGAERVTNAQEAGEGFLKMDRLRREIMDIALSLEPDCTEKGKVEL